MTDDAKPTVLLIHGAWHGSWCWDTVVSLLNDRQVVTVDLKSVDDASVGLAADAQVVRDAAAAIDGPVVAVAHSFGGIVATEGLAGLSNVKHILYVAAFVLDVGESLLQAAGGVPLEWWLVRDDGLVDPDTPAEIFFNDLPAAQAQEAIAQLRPQSYAAFKDPLSVAAWRDTPSTYLVATADNAIPAVVQRQMAQRCGTVHEVDSSHSPFLSQPQVVADLIRTAGLDAAR
ncbi:alpha/beta hydrolase [Kibdelosporangium philippinense]|uniref:Alpha/beta hydrolase n=1 Tax=Kibdelosporangium philippinense TaxID=211113 RepID=A0ABS8Z7I2_9PSEU|nr:alpha/beta fold hydrolase [Kibdelosporangium philippinense]MCE7003024.1 alpha/beta hydrolase [Kibdelosporangium philippinense]